MFRRRRFLGGVEASEIQWFNTSGNPMAEDDWANQSTRCMAIYLDGDDDPDLGADGRPLIDDDFLVLVNGWREPVAFTLPRIDRTAQWVTTIDTAEFAMPSGSAARNLPPGDQILVGDFSIVVLRAEPAADAAAENAPSAS